MELRGCPDGSGPDIRQLVRPESGEHFRHTLFSRLPHGGPRGVDMFGIRQNSSHC